MSDKPFYADSGVWQGAAAVVAIILSQCPPVRFWFKRAKLDAEGFNRIVLNEEVGSPHAQWHVSITNTGGREVRVQKITLTIARGQDRVELLAQSYFEKNSHPQPTLLTPFRLKPTDEWSHGVNFMLVAPREARQLVSSSVKAIKDDISAKLVGLPDQHPDVEADSRLVQPLLTLFDANFFWKTGEYEATLCIATNAPKANITRSFRFTLFESESEQLRAHRDQLKFGNGVYFRVPPVDPHYADLRPVY